MKINDILFEFAPPGSGDSGDDGFSEETLKRLASQWYNGNEDPRIEKALMAAGWEIGQDEGYDDEPGVFVVQSGDVNGNSYISWPAHELKQGVAEGYSLGKVLSLPELLGQIKHILTAKHRGIGWKMKMHGDNTFVFSAQNDYDVWSMLVVEAGGDDWVSVGHGMVDPDGKPIIFDRQQLPMTLASASEIADEAIQTYHDIDLSDYADDEYNQGVAEGAGNIGRQIKAVYKKIYDQGDDAVEFAYYDSPIFAQYWDEYEGDLDSIIAEVEPSELQVILDELTSAAEDQGLAEANAPFGTMGGGIRPPSGGATTQSPGIKPPSSTASSAPVADIDDWKAPHGDEQNEYRLFKSGEKPAVIVRGGMRQLYQPLLDTGNYPFKTMTSQGEQSLIIGQPSEEARVNKIYALVQTASDRAEAGDFSAYNNSNYHRLLGTLLGYPKDKIDQFVQHYFSDREDLAQQHYQMENKGMAEGQLNEGEQLFYARNPDGTRTYARIKDQGQLAQLQQKYAGSEVKLMSFNRPDVAEWLVSRGVNMRGFLPGMVITRGLSEEENKPEPPEADYGDDYQDMVARVKKLAGLGPLKTVYDPQKRVYKNVPTAVQPKKEQR